MIQILDYALVKIVFQDLNVISKTYAATLTVALTGPVILTQGLALVPIVFQEQIVK